MPTEDDSLAFQLKTKLERGEITQEEYQKLYKKFEELGLLESQPTIQSTKRSLRINGSRTIDGQVIEGPVIISGKVTVDGNLDCQTLSISGFTEVRGNLVVRKKAIVGGELQIESDGKFLGPVSITGGLNADRVKAVDRVSISGNVGIRDELTISGLLKILGELVVENIRSADVIKVHGTIIGNNILTKKFIYRPRNQTKKRSHITGSIRSEQITISPGSIMAIDPSSIENLNLDNIKVDLGGLGEIEDLNINFSKLEESIESAKSSLNSFIKTSLPKFVDDINTKTDGLVDVVDRIGGAFLKSDPIIIDGNLEAVQIQVSSADIGGDVIGTHVKIGNNVTIDGVIKYRKTIQVPDNMGYVIEKID